MDILSLTNESSNGNTCILVVADYFTKWTEAFALPDHQAMTVAEKLVTEVFVRFGVPVMLHSDQGREFRSELMSSLCKLLGTKATKTAPYHPRSDGQVERFNRTLLAMLSKLCDEHTEDWDDHLPYAMCAYRSTVSSTTGCSPNLMMLGRETNLPVDLMLLDANPRSFQCAVEYVEWVREAMVENHQRAREHLELSASRQKRYFDERARPRGLGVGDWVLRLYPPNLIRDKLNYSFVGPFLVVKKIGGVNYLVQRDKAATPITVHVDDLKAYHGPDAPDSWLTPDTPSFRETGIQCSGSDHEEEGGQRPAAGVDYPSLSCREEATIQGEGRPRRARKSPKRFGWDY